MASPLRNRAFEENTNPALARRLADAPEVTAGEAFSLRNPEADFTRGVRTASTGMIAGGLARDADKAEAQGNINDANRLRGEALRLADEAQFTSPRVHDFRDVEGVGDAVDFAQGLLGSAVPTIVPPLITGTAGAVAGGIVGGPVGAVAGGIAGASGPAFQLEAEELALSQQFDPVIAALPAEQRLREQHIKGLQNAALESIVPGVVTGRIFKGVRNAFKTGKRAGRVSARLATDAGTEGATELTQTLTGQASLARLNPDRDTQDDVSELINSTLAGIFAGGGLSLSTAVPGALLEATRAGTKAVGGRAKKGAFVVLDDLKPGQREQVPVTGTRVQRKGEKAFINIEDLKKSELPTIPESEVTDFTTGQVGNVVRGRHRPFKIADQDAFVQNLVATGQQTQDAIDSGEVIPLGDALSQEGAKKSEAVLEAKNIARDIYRRLSSNLKVGAQDTVIAGQVEELSALTGLSAEQVVKQVPKSINPLLERIGKQHPGRLKKALNVYGTLSLQDDPTRGFVAQDDDLQSFKQIFQRTGQDAEQQAAAQQTAFYVKFEGKKQPEKFSSLSTANTMAARLNLTGKDRNKQGLFEGMAGLLARNDVEGLMVKNRDGSFTKMKSSQLEKGSAFLDNLLKEDVFSKLQVSGKLGEGQKAKRGKPQATKEGIEEVLTQFEGEPITAAPGTKGTFFAERKQIVKKTQARLAKFREDKQVDADMRKRVVKKVQANIVAKRRVLGMAQSRVKVFEALQHAERAAIRKRLLGTKVYREFLDLTRQDTENDTNLVIEKFSKNKALLEAIKLRANEKARRLLDASISAEDSMLASMRETIGETAVPKQDIGTEAEGDPTRATKQEARIQEEDTAAAGRAVGVGRSKAPKLVLKGPALARFKRQTAEAKELKAAAEAKKKIVSLADKKTADLKKEVNRAITDSDLTSEDLRVLNEDILTNEGFKTLIPKRLSGEFNTWMEDNEIGESGYALENLNMHENEFLAEVVEGDDKQQALLARRALGEKLKGLSNLGGGARSTKLTAAEQKKLRAQIRVERGEAVVIELMDSILMDGASGASFLREGTDEQGDIVVDRVIQVAIDSVDPFGTGFHESLHDFVREMKDLPSGQAMYRKLAKLANAPHIKAQLRKLIKAAGGDPTAALAQIESSVEERIAYMYQFWASNPNRETKLNITPSTENIFKRWARGFAKILGILSTSEQAELVMQALRSGKVTSKKGIAEVSQSMQDNRSFPAKVVDILPAVQDALRTTYLSATNRLRKTGVPAYNKMADLLYQSPDQESGPLGMTQRQAQKFGQFKNQYNDILEGASAADVEVALTNMQAMRAPSSSLEQALTSLLAELFTYMDNAGVKYMHVTESKGKKTASWEKVQRVKNYFPRIWNASKIAANEPKFRALLKKEGKMKDKEINQFIHQLSTNDGTPDLSTTPDLSAKADAVNPRQFTWITPANAKLFTEFQDDDLTNIMTTYMRQAAHRAEHSRTWGAESEKLFALRDQGIEEGATKKQQKTMSNAIKAMHGTLGVEKVSPALRTAMTGTMTAVNIAVLPLALFSSLVDPLGVAIRTGKMKDAFRAYKIGVQQLVADVTKSGDLRHQGVNVSQLTRMLGAIDSQGISSAIGSTFEGTFMSARLRKWNQKFFNYIGLEGWTQGVRIAAMVAGQHYLLDNATDTKVLDAMGLQRGDVKPIGDGWVAITQEEGLTAEQEQRMQQAMFRFIDGAVLRPTAGQRPIFMSDARFILLGHLKQFTFSFQNTIVRQAAAKLAQATEEKDAAKAVAVMLPLLSYVPFMIAADMLRSVVAGRDKDDTLEELLINGVQRSAITGVSTFAFDAADDTKYGGLPVNTLLGPTAALGIDLLEGALDPDKDFIKAGVKLLPGSAAWRGWID